MSTDAAGVVTDDRHPPIEAMRLVTVLDALADPARLTTVRTLAAAGECACTELYHLAGLTIGRSTFSHHQKILREAGVLRERIHGAQRIVRIRREDLDARFPGLLAAVLDADE